MNEFCSEKEKDRGVLVLQTASGKQEECTKSWMLDLPRFQNWTNWMFAGISFCSCFHLIGAFSQQKKEFMVYFCRCNFAVGGREFKWRHVADHIRWDPLGNPPSSSPSHMINFLVYRLILLTLKQSVQSCTGTEQAKFQIQGWPLLPQLLWLGQCSGNCWPLGWPPCWPSTFWPLGCWPPWPLLACGLSSPGAQPCETEKPPPLHHRGLSFSPPVLTFASSLSSDVSSFFNFSIAPGSVLSAP